ncbi:unnamed protein product, partial [Iphiclides podalirius]
MSLSIVIQASSSKKSLEHGIPNRIAADNGRRVFVTNRRNQLPDNDRTRGAEKRAHVKPRGHTPAKANRAPDGIPLRPVSALF